MSAWVDVEHATSNAAITAAGRHHRTLVVVVARRIEWG
jgi:predicted transcriptional regulator